MTEIKEIIGRLKATVNAKSDEQLAPYLGISRQNIAADRERDDVPPGAESNSNISYCQEGSFLAR